MLNKNLERRHKKGQQKRERKRVGREGGGGGGRERAEGEGKGNHFPKSQTFNHRICLIRSLATIEGNGGCRC